MSRISDIITGKKVASSKPAFSKLFSVEDTKIDELENETVVCVFLKVMRFINESYELMVRSSWGTRAIIFNPIEFKLGKVVRQEFHFRKRPIPIDKIELYADGVKVKGLQNLLTFKVEDYEFKMKFVGHGTFEMGEGLNKHKVTLTDYYIGEVPVTQKIWELIMNNNPSLYRINGENKPVEHISWEECHTFIEKLNIKFAPVLSNRKFRLPTEAEWEFAAYGGKAENCLKFSGSNDIRQVAWFKFNSSGVTHDVATLTPNELGLYDMCGNINEWCEDVWFYKFSNKDLLSSDLSVDKNKEYVVKGGSFDDEYNKCRIVARQSGNIAFNTIGLRLCLS